MQYLRVYIIGTRYIFYLTVDFISGEDSACMFGKQFFLELFFTFIHAAS